MGMPDINSAIKVNNVSKKFKIYHSRAVSLKERIIFWNQNASEEFWALQGVSFEIPKGAAVGLIGRNGSGKSTLLKLISRILYPTGGCIGVNGRISTLLELGAGFHPDFTGRENIFFNASILGFSRDEIKSKLNDIISFADLGDFVDNPVRNYSTGMYSRLGFSVAIHVDPDILLIDEVLAVGDLAFQKKCLNKINELREKKKTIILVTHSSQNIRDYCDMAIWLDHGKLQMIDTASRVVAAYESFLGIPDSGK
ncbi:MAG: ABC transporter ATP-binding protein [Desulfocucumaceae bacterium]